MSFYDFNKCVFLNAFCKKSLNEKCMQQWQSEHTAKDFTRMEVRVCVYKVRVPFMKELSILGSKTLCFIWEKYLSF